MKFIKKDFIWNTYAIAYDSLLNFIPYQELIEKMLHTSSINSNEVIADLGCGTGNIEYLNKVKDVDFYCFDISDSMLKRAKKKNKCCKFFKYDLSRNNIPVADNFFDKVVSSNVVYNIKDVVPFFKDIQRVLKKNGLFIFTTSTSDGLTPLIKKHLKSLTLYSFLKSLIYFPAFIYVLIINVVIDKSSKYYFYKESELLNYLKKSGFKIISVNKCYEDLNSIFVAKKV